jgi:hypothetical protein
MGGGLPQRTFSSNLAHSETLSARILDVLLIVLQVEFDGNVKCHEI